MFSFNPTLLSWPSIGGYATYTGGFPDTDDEGASASVAIADFAMNGTVYNTLWFSTNGSVTFNSATSAYEGYPSESTQICANNDDMELDPNNITLTDGDVHNIYYMLGSNFTKIICHQGYHEDPTAVGSWLLNIYRDEKYQWIETRLKVPNEDEIYSGPYNEPNADVSVPVSTSSQVWRSDLLGQNWEFMGTGSVGNMVETTCSPLNCDVPAFKCYLGTSKSCTCARWKYFTAQCTRNQQALGICNGTSGAFVPAITVCNQRLL